MVMLWLVTRLVAHTLVGGSSLGVAEAVQTGHGCVLA